MADRVLGRFDAVEILVCCAGTTVRVPFPDLAGVQEQDWDRLMAVNVKGAFLCSQALAPTMVQCQQGRIVTVSSVAGLKPSGTSIPYCVSKAGLVMLTRCLAMGLAPHVLVNSVAPGLMRTLWWAGYSDERIEVFTQSALTKQASKVEDVVAAILFLLRTDTVTGHILAVDGGMMQR